jgi:hypothetical protein
MGDAYPGSFITKARRSIRKRGRLGKAMFRSLWQKASEESEDLGLTSVVPTDQSLRRHTIDPDNGRLLVHVSSVPQRDMLFS